MSLSDQIYSSSKILNSTERRAASLRRRHLSFLLKCDLNLPLISRNERECGCCLLSLPPWVTYLHPLRNNHILKALMYYSCSLVCSILFYFILQRGAGVASIEVRIAFERAHHSVAIS